MIVVVVGGSNLIMVTVVVKIVGVLCNMFAC